jgi:transposase
LWAAVTSSAALFLIHLRRGVVGLKALLGEAVQGLVCSDRWSAYLSIPAERRQLCWAHLRRDFQAMINRGGVAKALGADLLLHADLLFDLWYKVRDGTRRRRWLLGHVND